MNRPAPGALIQDCLKFPNCGDSLAHARATQSTKRTSNTETGLRSFFPLLFAVHSGMEHGGRWSVVFFFYRADLGNSVPRGESNLKFWWRITSLIANLHAWDILARVRSLPPSLPPRREKWVITRNHRRNCRAGGSRNGGCEAFDIVIVVVVVIVIYRC
jgi:hypothetical protein